MKVLTIQEPYATPIMHEIKNNNILEILESKELNYENILGKY